MALRLAPAAIPVGGPLFGAYAGLAAGDAVDRDQGVAGFYHYDPLSPDGVRRRAAAVDREFDGDRTQLSVALKALAVRLGDCPCPAAGAAAARIAHPDSLAVVTGQQAGLLTGPLYTIHKAAGALALAGRLEAELGRPVIPIFWAATEDHDVAEANQAWIADRHGEWQMVRCALPAEVAGLSVGAVPLPGKAAGEVLDALESLMPAGMWGPPALELASVAAREARTLGDWFCRLVQAMFGPLGLVVFDPMEPRLRELAARGVARILSASGELSSALASGEERVARAGYTPQVSIETRDAQLFMYPDGPQGPRRALEREGERGFRLRGGGAGYLPGELEEMVCRHPERFSGNVVTRPVLQDMILPTVAYVAGPAEIAYFGQCREAYEALGLTMPVIWPRSSLTLVEPAIARLLSRHGLGPKTVPAQLRPKREEILVANDPVGAEGLVAGLKRTVDESYAGVIPQLERMDRVLGRLAEENRRRVEGNVTWLSRKARQVLRQRSAAGLGQLDRIESALWPRRGPQERTANVFSYLGRWGMGLLAELSALPPGPPFVHQYAYLE